MLSVVLLPQANRLGGRVVSPPGVESDTVSTSSRVRMTDGQQVLMLELKTHILDGVHHTFSSTNGYNYQTHNLDGVQEALSTNAHTRDNQTAVNKRLTQMESTDEFILRPTPNTVLPSSSRVVSGSPDCRALTAPTGPWYGPELPVASKSSNTWAHLRHRT